MPVHSRPFRRGQLRLISEERRQKPMDKCKVIAATNQKMRIHIVHLPKGFPA